MEISKFKKQSIYGSEYYCYGPTMLDGVKDYYLNQYDNFQFSKDKGYSLIDAKETPDFRRCNICNITAMIMCLKLMNIELPREPKYNKNNISLSRAEEKLAQFMYSNGIKDPTLAPDLIRGTNLWLQKNIAKKVTGTRGEMKKAIEDLLYGLPVLTSGYFFNAKDEKNKEDEEYGKFKYYSEKGEDGRYINQVDEKGETIKGIQGHYVCMSAVAFKNEYKEGEEPVYYQIQDPYAKTFSSATQQYPYNTIAETGGTTGKDVWLTKEQFELVFSPRKDENAHRAIRFASNAAVIDEKWQELSKITTLPDLLNNYNLKGWFSKDAVTSYMYSSGYEKINGKYPGLVKIFDTNREVEGYSPIEVKPEAGLKGNKLIIKEDEFRFIDNLSSINPGAESFSILRKKLDYFFRNKKDRRYFVGDLGNADSSYCNRDARAGLLTEGPFKTLLRYPQLRDDINKFFFNFIDGSGNGYLINGGTITKEQKEDNDQYSEQNQKLPELKKGKGYINLKKLYAIVLYLEEGKDIGLLEKSEIRTISGFKEQRSKERFKSATGELFFCLNYILKEKNIEELKSSIPGITYIENFVKQLGLDIESKNEIGWFSIFLLIAYLNSGVKDGELNTYGYTKGGIEIDTPKIDLASCIKNSEGKYWPETDEQYKELNEKIKDINKNEQSFYGIMKDKIFYIEDEEKQASGGFKVGNRGIIPIKNFGNKVSAKNAAFGITEISFPITKEKILGESEKYIFEGIRIYIKYTSGIYGNKEYKKNNKPIIGGLFSNDGRNFNSSIKNFDICLKKKIGELDGTDESIKELCFFFRYMNEGSVDHKKLYRYTISLEKYENVINANNNDKRALYFVPFICDFSKLTGLDNFMFEAYYGDKNENEELQLGYIDKKKFNDLLEPAIVKTYVQLGRFKNDYFNITRDIKSNSPCKGIIVTTDQLPSMKLPGGIEYCVSFTTPEAEGENVIGEIPYGFDKELTAKDLEDVVVGCFSLNPPEVKGEDGWASSGDSNAKSVLLDSITKTANEKDIYKYTLKVIEKKENGDKVKHNFGEVSPEDIKKLVNLDKKTLKINKFEYYTGYGVGDELVDYPEDPIDYGDVSIPVGSPYNAGQKLFTMELQYGFNTNKEKLYPNKENLTDEEKKRIVWEPDSVNCKVNGSQIVSLGSKDEIVASDGERGKKGKPLLLEKVTESMINKSANLLGERISLINVSSSEDCNMYINNLGYLVHGYGLSYSLACITDDNAIKKEFEKCIENNKNNLFKVGKEYAVIEKPKKDLSSMNVYEQKMYQNTINEKSKKLRGYKEKAYIQNKLVERNVISGYGVPVSKAKEVLGKYISDISLGKVITCLKLWQMALEGETDFSEEAAEKKYSQNISLFEKKTMGNLNQEAYEDLVAVSIFNEDFKAMQRGVFKEISDEVKEAELTDEQKKETFEICFKRYLNSRAYSNFNKYKLNNFKVKDFLKKEINNFNIIMSSNKVKPVPIGNLTSKKLIIELTCTAVTGGLLNSVMGGGFNKLAQKE